MHPFISSSQYHPDAGAIIISILHMRKVSHREAKELAQGHTASKSESWDLNGLAH